jgi:hypothetical protein
VAYGDKKFVVANIFSVAALWGLWKLRNGLCFQGNTWKYVKFVILKIVIMIQGWSVLCPSDHLQDFSSKLAALKKDSSQPSKVDMLLNDSIGRRFLFLNAMNWKDMPLQAGAEELLSRSSSVEEAVESGKWLNLAALGVSWEM